jgi:hypothetical protein
MSDGSAPKSHDRTGAVFIIVLPMLYVLSIGPVYQLAATISESGEASSAILPAPPGGFIDRLYTPLFWLRDHTPLKELFHRYLRWWEPEDPASPKIFRHNES